MRSSDKNRPPAKKENRMTVSSHKRSPAKGPLRVFHHNPRYFTDGSGKAIYLTGSHTWANFQDNGSTDPPPVFDYNRYLDHMVELNHNFIRLWVWEQARWAPWADGKESKATDWFYHPAWAYARTGPGTALDGKPKFDLHRFDSDYFERLRSRVKAARDRGIYVSIMLFQGWSEKKGWLGGEPFRGHPYNPKNNVQVFDGGNSNANGPDLNGVAVRDLQVAYIHQVVDTVNDLDNVLYEVTNEGGNREWDWFVVNTVHRYEKTKTKQHPVGITGHGSEDNATMLASPADWFSPGSNDWPDLKTDPRAVEGKKISLLDTDHVFGVGGDGKWVWKGFMRGHNVLFMDPYNQEDWEFTEQGTAKEALDSARRAMGETLSYATRMDLAETTPHNDLSSTGYCLANPGKEYLVYLPEGGEATVDLTSAKGSLAVEWMRSATGEVTKGEAVEGGEKRTFRAPFAGDAALFLHTGTRR
jgi:hypothetical protein